MNCPFRFVLFATCFLSATLTLLASEDRSPAPLTADEIMTQVVQTSTRSVAKLNQLSLTYGKRAIVERVDDRGQSRDRDEKLFRVFFRSGKVTMKLLQSNDKDVTGALLEEGGVPASVEEGKAPRGEERPLILTRQTVARFNFKLLAKEHVNGRQAYLVQFYPKTGLAENSIYDRFMNQLTGKLWVDVGDFDIARARVRLRAPVTLWGGVLGALKKFDYSLDRVRLDTGMWFNSSSRGDFELRKLFSSKHFRSLSEWSDVQTERGEVR